MVSSTEDEVRDAEWHEVHGSPTLTPTLRREPDLVNVDTGEVIQSRPLVQPYSTSQSLFGTDDPVEIVEKSSAVAKALADILGRQNLYKRIGDKNHVLVEGWTLLGSLLGVFPVLESCHHVEVEGVLGFRAIVNAQTRSGDVVGRAEAYCMRNEKRWANAETYAVASMAQTRATSKALRLPLGFIVQLAGYESTPAEEIPDNEPVRVREVQAPKWAAPSSWKQWIVRLKAIDEDAGWDVWLDQGCVAVYGAPFAELPKAVKGDEVWKQSLEALKRLEALLEGREMPPPTRAEIGLAFSQAFGQADETATVDAPDPETWLAGPPWRLSPDETELPTKREYDEAEEAHGG